MKLNYLLIPVFAVLVLFASCIQDEAPNAEADILTCSLPKELLVSEPTVKNDEVLVYVKPDVVLSELVPQFTYTEGAKIKRLVDAETSQDIQLYRVTSEDGQWSKVYKVMFLFAGLKTKYDFTHYEKIENIKYKWEYYSFYELKEGTDVHDNIWSSGNAGYSMTGLGQNAMNYPTVPDNNGVKGDCVKLETKSTGSFGADPLIHMPIAAGNLFLGTFSTMYATSKPLEATQFGKPFTKIPKQLIYYYKYKAGEKFIELDGNYNVVEVDRKDEPDLYAVFYEAVDGKTLDGNNILSDDANIISRARLKGLPETDTWERIAVSFETVNDIDIDPVKLKEGRYYLAVVFSSSIDGAYFKGAIGSTLYVDEVEVVCEE